MTAEIWIIVKYSDFYDDPISQDLSFADTYTGRQMQKQGMPKTFASQKEGEPWLQKAIDLNPSVGYNLRKVSI